MRRARPAQAIPARNSLSGMVEQDSGEIFDPDQTSQLQIRVSVNSAAADGGVRKRAHSPSAQTAHRIARRGGLLTSTDPSPNRTGI